MNSRWKVFLIALSAVVAVGGTALASSHREAPFVTRHPKVDATDFYMFRSYETGRSAYVTLIANYIPIQAPYGGPNYFTMDPDALYEIHVDNDGNAEEDITFQFRFQETYQNLHLNIGGKNVAVPLINTGTVSSGSTGNLHRTETYSLKIVRGDRRTGTVQDVTHDGEKVFTKPVDYIGDKTFTNLAGYEDYADDFIYDIDIPGCGTQGKVFVGQRRDPFPVNLGEVFDLVNTNPLGSPTGEANLLDDANVTALALEIPISCLTNGDEDVIGGWTTASLRQARVLNPSPLPFDASVEGGAWTQVSRLGMPLVNEIVIGLPDKDRFNASEPKDDGQFLTYVTNPTFPAILNLLFSVDPPAPPRSDLVAAFLTGVSGLNQPAGIVGSEMLRLNTTTAVTVAGSQSNLGVLGADNAGFPNGRRPGDDVVDIELRVAMGVLQEPDPGIDGELAYTDGASFDAGDFDTAFPYLLTPLPGSPSN